MPGKICLHDCPSPSAEDELSRQIKLISSSDLTETGMKTLSRGVYVNNENIALSSIPDGFSCIVAIKCLDD